MLVDDVALLAIKVRRELLWQTLVENLFDRDAHLGPALLALPPVEHKLLFRNLLQELFGDRFDLLLLLLGKPNCGLRQEVEDRGAGLYDKLTLRS